ncbi:MAG: aminotransferase class I/II-fold pyridoxal phosphate-dependent enzyme [Hydrotalea flava]|nr:MULTISPECIES: aminotransferase class I/II-fold pyridoxal phosphate-dependent enzyme [Hydrotalea]NIM35921.1 aminotransferase class I/II-fold pyridoxal phosphate-dependent enzyme [Hydrotalea flava]GHU01081.1 aminotransferase [Betaproteobacteria bacterium]NIM38754.1 aminotransferase class I/II-fold pyridoxal phosphate-dependent enzyme [Hydrotalea flava]NIN03942.1 aminotransferase class I/II-fold pyridoxal phosphate-dependent enzyme [Hydrotalea flava]NIN15663.1 aminotransferase class I/II-fold 
MIPIADRLQGVGEYYFSGKLREIDALNREGKQIINLGIGSPDMPPHPDVITALQQNAALPNVHGYQSYKGALVLRKAIADWYKVWYQVDLDSETEILPLIGSKEGLMHICMTYLNPGDEVLVPNPGYPTYSSAVTLAGGICRNYEMKEQTNWAPDFNALAQEDLSKVKLMFVNYPHMPTGQNGHLALFEKMVAFAHRHQILIVHDNPYSFILNEHPVSMLQVNGAKDVVIELNSLSKSHNMAGWRVGMLCGRKERIDEVLRFKSNMDSGMFLPLQLAAAKALSLGKDWFIELNKVYARRREKVFELLDLLKCIYQTNQVGLFVWASVPNTIQDGFAMSDSVLYNAGVFITPGGIFGTAGNQYVRISLCATEEKLMEAIHRIK